MLSVFVIELLKVIVNITVIAGNVGLPLNTAKRFVQSSVYSAMFFIFLFALGVTKSIPAAVLGSILYYILELVPAQHRLEQQDKVKENMSGILK